MEVFNIKQFEDFLNLTRFNKQMFQKKIAVAVLTVRSGKRKWS